MPCRRDCCIGFAQCFIAFGCQFDGKPWSCVCLPLAAEPQTQENLSFQSEGDIVVSKRLVFRHAIEREDAFPYFFNIHGALSIENQIIDLTDMQLQMVNVSAYHGIECHLAAFIVCPIVVELSLVNRTDDVAEV